MDIDINMVLRAKEGDADAFTGLYELMYKEMYKSAYFSLGRKEDAEDAVSDAVCDAWDSIGSLREPKAFAAWMFRILYVKCQRKRAYYMTEPSELKDEDKNGAVLVREEGSAAFRSGSSTFDAELLDSMSEVSLALLALSKEERDIIVLHVIGGFKTREIAEITGLLSSTVRSKESRALKKLRRSLS